MNARLDIHHIARLFADGAETVPSRAACAVYVTMLGSASEDGCCHLSINQLAAMIRGDWRTASTAVQELVAAGLIAPIMLRGTPRGHIIMGLGSVPTTEGSVPTTEGSVPTTEPLAPAYPQTESIPPYISPQGGNDRPPKRKVRAPFVKPDPHEVAAFFKANGSSGPEAGRYWNHYEANGWKVGRNPMANWQAAARNWISGRFVESRASPSMPASSGMAGPTVDQVTAWKAAAEERRASQERHQ